jgi:hypothetical protein
MSPTRYRLSFRDPELPDGWVQAVADHCEVRIHRSVTDYSMARMQMVADQLPLALAADHVARFGMNHAELTFGGIVRYDWGFVEWAHGRFRGPPVLGEMIVAQFDAPDGWCGWRAWGRYDHAVDLRKMTMTGLEIEHIPELRVVVLKITVAALGIQQSSAPSPVVQPPDLLPGTLFYPYVPLQISSAWPAGEEKP